MSDQAIDILKKRLASGEVTLEEYKTILKELEGVKNNNDQQVKTSRQLVATIDEDFKLFNDAIVYKGSTFLLSDVTAIKNYSSKNTLNFVTMDRLSCLTITFKNSKEICITEDRAWFGKKRHDEILVASQRIKKLTFNHRVTNFADKLLENNKIKLSEDYLKKDPSKDVFLFRDGTIRTPHRSIDLKKARINGTLFVGTRTEGILSHYRASNSNEIAVTETPHAKNGKIPKDAVIFTPYLEDVDVSCAFIDFLSIEGNQL